MAPEQLRGRPADKRTDVWAFGCLLYELLTCTRAFPGVDVAETLSNVLNTEPDWTALPSATPIGIQRVLRRALEKDRKKRLPDLGVVRLEIDDRTTGPRDGLSTSRAASSGRWIAALLVVAVALVGAFMVGRWSQPSMREIHLNLDTPETQALSSFALSPDGRWVIYAANSDGRPSLWMRSLDTGDVRALAGTADGIRPFWSPDGRSVGFFAGTKLKRLNLADGSIETLARVMNAQGGSWGRDNTILYNPAGFVGGLYRVNAGGGDLAVVTRPDSAGQIGHHSPQWLPDDEHFLYNAGGDPKVRGTYINTRDGSEPRRVIDAPAVYANEELLFIRDGVLYSQPFSIALGLLTGTPQRIATEVAAASVSARGDIVYRPIVAEGERQLVWFDRMGKELERVGSVWVGSVTNPSLSPDGRRVLVQRSSGQNADIWIVDLGTGLPSRLTSNPALDSSPIWSADGRKVLFNSSRRGQSDLFEKAPEITGEERPVVTGAGEKLPSDWSRDGEHILYRAYDQKTGWDIWATRATGERASFPVVRTEFDERDAQFSPDGRSIAFQSDESGQAEIYVQAFPAGEKRRLSTAGGTQPRWRADGKELFYVTLDGVLSAVSLDRGVGDSSTPGVPMPLFSPKMYGTSFTRQQYVVAPNGRFLVMMQIRESPTAPLTVILNRRTDRSLAAGSSPDFRLPR
jgi:Tol biopolymer transport system component